MNTGKLSEARLARTHEIIAGHVAQPSPGTLRTAVIQV
jgi:hypothetical protein